MSRSIRFAPTIPETNPQKDTIPIRFRLEEPKAKETVSYSVPSGRVRRLIGRLAKVDTVPLNDSKFITKLKISLDDEYDKECKNRMCNREKSEITRIRKLCINGEMEPPEELAEDLKSNPVYRINRMISNMKNQMVTKQTTGCSTFVQRALTPIEPFAAEYKNYFLKSHLTASGIDPSRSSMVSTVRPGKSSKFKTLNTKLDVDQIVSQKDLTEIRGPDSSKDKTNETTSPKGVKFSSTVDESEENELTVTESSPVGNEKPVNPVNKRSILQTKESILKLEESSQVSAFKPYLSELVNQVKNQTEPYGMYEMGSKVLQTFTRQAKVAELALKKIRTESPSTN